MPGGWDFEKAVDRAQRRIAEAAGVTVAEVAQMEGDYVTRARKQAEIMAPALMKQQMALLLGTDPEELDRVRGGARLLLEGSKQVLAIVGLRAGEEISMDVSERMQAFLTRWNDRRALPVAAPDDSWVVEGEIVKEKSHG